MRCNRCFLFRAPHSALRAFCAGLLLLAGVLCCGAPARGASAIHVAPNGSDDGDGSEARPLATLERARDVVRALKRTGVLPLDGIVVWVKGGVYPRTETFELTADDSGDDITQMVYRARGEARLHAGTPLKSTAFKPVTDAATLTRLDAAAEGKIVQLDLATAGLAHAGPFPKVFNGGGGIVELFFGDERMPLSRWPNEGFATMGRVLDKGDWSTGSGRHGGAFVARDERPARWRVKSGVWLEGYWRVPWDPQTVWVKSIDAEKREITFAEPVNGGIGSKYGGDAGDGKEPWCAVNLLEEIDRPGEWCIDFTTQTLYFWPPGELSGAAVYASDFDQPLIRLKDVSYVTFRGFQFEGGLGNGIEIDGGAGNLIAGCTFKNLGANGVVVRGGTGHSVRSSDFYALGHGGILLGGGDRRKLTPSNHVAENNHLHHLGIRKKTYAAAIAVGAYGAGEAVGARVANNLIHDLPHAGVLYGGNDHVMEFNEIHDVVQTSADMGAFYTSHDWTSHGNMLRYNFVHDSPRANAFYADDGDSGDTIFGNVVYRLFYGPFIGGGHDNLVQNNLIVDCERGIHVDSRGVARDYANDRGLVSRLEATSVTEPPWSTKYPSLGRLTAARRALPTGNLVEYNVMALCKQSLHFTGKKEDLAGVTLRDNLDLGSEDPGFVDAAQLDFRLKKDSPIYKRLPAFKPIPLERIGLYRDEYRVKLPPRDGRAQSENGSAAGRAGAIDSEVDVQRSNQLKNK